MDLLSPIIGETAARIVILVGVLLLLAALTMLLIGIAFRVFGGRRFGFGGRRNRAPRLSVPDIMPVDSKRKLVLVRRDTVEHLLLIGGATDLVIEQSIQRPVQAARSRIGVNGVYPTAAQPIATQSEIAPAAPTEAPAPPAVSGRLGIPMPPPRGTRPTATAASPIDYDMSPPVDQAAETPPVRQVGIAMPPRPMPPQEISSPASMSDGSLARSAGEIARNGGSDSDEGFATVPLAANERLAAKGNDEQLERDLAAAIPDMVENGDPSAGRAEPATDTVPEDMDRERAQRLTSRESEMAQLLTEIFGKR